MEFEGKFALVTGAASGIGAATARLLVARGARVIAADRDGEKLGELRLELGPDVQVLVADLAEADAPAQMIEDAVAIGGGLDILVNNAGIGALARVGNATYEDWRRVFTIDLDAVFLASKAALPTLLERRGNIVCTASISGIAADYGFAAYNSAKAGLIGLVRNMAIDYAAEGLRVNAVSPGYTRTAMTAMSHPDVKTAFEAQVPMQRGADPAEIAEAIVFLASDRASYITGQNLAVDGGMTAHTGQPDVAAIYRKLAAQSEAGD